MMQVLKYGEIVPHAGDDNLLLAVGAAIEKLIPATPPPPAPTCSGCSAIAGRAHLVGQALSKGRLALNMSGQHCSTWMKAWEYLGS